MKQMGLDLSAMD